MRLALFGLTFVLLASPATAQLAITLPVVPVTLDTVNRANIRTIPAHYLPTTQPSGSTASRQPDPAIVRLQVLLDRVGASPGVIDGLDGDNVRKAVSAFELMQGLPPDGVLDPDTIARLETGGPVLGDYPLTTEDRTAIGEPIPKDYAEQATREFLGYASIEEELAERFHMDVDLLRLLNPSASYDIGEAVVVAAYGPDSQGTVVRIEADKSLRQLRAYGHDDRLIAAYPATIGSDDTPSPTGVHLVEGVARMPDYTYNPKVNFHQGGNDGILMLPPGPNGPVGSVWIDLNEPTFGIHGTPEPSLIDKTASHGCIRLTNWDANELATMVKPGVPVAFIG